jgi:hypothetical protein
MHQIPLRSSRWTGSLARAQLHASCGFRRQNSRSKMSMTGRSIVVVTALILPDSHVHASDHRYSRLPYRRPRDYSPARRSASEIASEIAQAALTNPM